MCISFFRGNKASGSQENIFITYGIEFTPFFNIGKLFLGRNLGMHSFVYLMISFYKKKYFDYIIVFVTVFGCCIFFCSCCSFTLFFNFLIVMFYHLMLYFFNFFFCNLNIFWVNFFSCVFLKLCAFWKKYFMHYICNQHLTQTGFFVIRKLMRGNGS